MREHVTPYITGKLGDICAWILCNKTIHNTDCSNIRLTLDRKEDLK